MQVFTLEGDPRRHQQGRVTAKSLSVKLATVVELQPSGHLSEPWLWLCHGGRELGY